MSKISAEHVCEAAERIRPIVRRTPVMTSRAFDAAARVSAVFKCENFQRGGSFKIRGAANFIYSMAQEDLPRGVVAYSSGNHAQAVAIAAASVDAPATLIMPSDSPRCKLEATRAYGATVVTYDRFREDREAIGERIARESGATLVPPFDHAWTIAGQGTAAMELLEQAHEIDALIAPVGGGGLLSGCAIAAKAAKPGIRVFGAEPLEANDTYLSLQAGERVTIASTQTIADGLRSPRPGAITFPIIQQNVENVVLVSEDEIRQAVKFLLERLKILVEPSGAVSAAAVLFGKLPADVQSVGVILSGGNVDFDVLAGF